MSSHPLIAILIVGVAACDDGSDATTDTTSATDTSTETTTGHVRYHFHGEAEGDDTAANVRAECVLDAVIDDPSESAAGFTGMAGGEVFRTVFPDTRRFEFQALIGGPVSLDDGALRLVGDQPDDAKPFWLGLEVLTAVKGADGNWTGTFECRPMDFDLGGYVDDELTVEGTFTLERTEVP